VYRAGLGVERGDGLEVGNGLGAGDGVAVGVGLGLGDGERLGVPVGWGVGLGVDVAVGDGLGVAVGCGLGVGLAVGLGVGECLGPPLLPPPSGFVAIDGTVKTRLQAIVRSIIIVLPIDVRRMAVQSAWMLFGLSTTFAAL